MKAAMEIMKPRMDERRRGLVVKEVKALMESSRRLKKLNLV